MIRGDENSDNGWEGGTDACPRRHECPCDACVSTRPGGKEKSSPIPVGSHWLIFLRTFVEFKKSRARGRVCVECASPRAYPAAPKHARTHLHAQCGKAGKEKARNENDGAGESLELRK
ncbi:unnamed protein product [Taenia asiatica]|uniref:Uncharacterized protein n=1 Tax=Taenia asiatica TaxID=60517 RepID=A0A0R3WB06_TAEAS|nr:unnamed protein product [Taenia asiatica]